MSDSISQSIPSTEQEAIPTSKSQEHNAEGQLTESRPNAPRTTELTGEKIRLQGALRHFADFPIPGIDFVDILPLFADPAIHETLLFALELQVLSAFPKTPDVVVALDARGFLFGPSLALKLGASFAPVRKPGKLPGPVATASYKKEYGEDLFQMQMDAIKPGQTVLVVDDIIATGGSAEAAGKLVKQLGGDLLGFLFILELDFLHGRDRLSAPVSTLLAQDTPE